MKRGIVRIGKPPFPSLIRTCRPSPSLVCFAFEAKFSSISSFTAAADEDDEQRESWTNVRRLDRNANRLRFILNKNPASYTSTQQIHARLVTAGALYKSLVLFKALLRCYCFGEFPHQAFLLYRHLCLLPLSFDSFTYVFLIKTCANLCDPVLGSQLHGVTEKLGFGPHVYVQTALVNMYALCGVMFDAKKIFDEMPQRNCVTWNALITGFVRWGQLEIARSLFDEMPERSVVSWTGLIDGYTRMNRPDEALALFRRMCVQDGIQPSGITMLAVFPGISNIGDPKICRLIHGFGEKRGFYVSDVRVMNSLIDTYAKCGCILSASRFFEEMPSEKRNLVSWTSMISGFAMHGMGKEAVQTFERMEYAGWKPNRVTFLGLLSACSHGGLVDEGLKFFEKMVNEGQILPDVKHYGCVVDMLGRAGRLEEAEKMALKIPSEANVVVWRTLLGSCSFHGNVEVGERVSKKIMEIERQYGGDYVLMYNILAGAGRFGDAEGFRRLMDGRNAIKVPGNSFV